MTVRGLIFPFFFVLLEAMVFKKKISWNKAKCKISIYVAEVIKMS